MKTLRFEMTDEEREQIMAGAIDVIRGMSDEFFEKIVRAMVADEIRIALPPALARKKDAKPVIEAV